MGTELAGWEEEVRQVLGIYIQEKRGEEEAWRIPEIKKGWGQSFSALWESDLKSLNLQVRTTTKDAVERLVNKLERNQDEKNELEYLRLKIIEDRAVRRDLMRWLELLTRERDKLEETVAENTADIARWKMEVDYMT